MHNSGKRKRGEGEKKQDILRNLPHWPSWVLGSYCGLFFLGIVLVFFMRKFSFIKWSSNVFRLIFSLKSWPTFTFHSCWQRSATAQAGVISQWGEFHSCREEGPGWPSQPQGLWGERRDAGSPGTPHSSLLRKQGPSLQPKSWGSCAHVPALGQGEMVVSLAYHSPL